MSDPENQPSRRLAFVRAGATALLCLLCSRATAHTIYLWDQNRGPATSLEVSGVTFSGDFTDGGGTPTSVSGSGMGSTNVGRYDSVDAQWHFDQGSLVGNNRRMEALSLTPGTGVTLNALTLVPHFSATGYDNPAASSFTIAVLISACNSPTAWNYYSVCDGVPMTIDLHSDFYNISQVNLALWSNGANDNRFYNYRSQYGTPDATLQFGFTIQSMDITVVPEPTAASLLCLGAIALPLLRRFGRKPAHLGR